MKQKWTLEKNDLLLYWHALRLAQCDRRIEPLQQFASSFIFECVVEDAFLGRSAESFKFGVLLASLSLAPFQDDLSNTSHIFVAITLFLLLPTRRVLSSPPWWQNKKTKTNKKETSKLKQRQGNAKGWVCTVPRISLISQNHFTHHFIPFHFAVV